MCGSWSRLYGVAGLVCVGQQVWVVWGSRSGLCGVTGLCCVGWQV